MLRKAFQAMGLAVLLVLSAAPARAADFDPVWLNSVVSVLPEFEPDEARARLGAPEGSGTVLFAGGYVVTNVHVLGLARSARVRTADGRLLAATILGRDGASDIALLRIDADLPVPALRLDPPALGEPVCAVGNAFGLDLSLSCGIVSAVRRTNTGFNPVEDFVQTDAAINPGGSGGALFDAQGRLVGMVSAIFTKSSDANVGVNFAASARLLARVAGDLRDFGRVQRGKSGLRVGPLGEEDAAMRSGVRVVHVLEKGAALSAGIEVGDILTAIDGRPVRQGSDVTAAVALRRPGDVLDIALIRSGSPLTLRLRLTP